MDNQHRHIKGYRELTADEIDMMNKAKALAEEVGKLIDYLAVTNSQTGGYCIDMRWVNIGKTQLQQGFMAVIRGIAKPTTF